MKHPVYTLFAVASCAWLAFANTRGWSFIRQGTSANSLTDTSYRYRPSYHVSSGSSSGGSWFSGGGFHK